MLDNLEQAVVRMTDEEQLGSRPKTALANFKGQGRSRERTELRLAAPGPRRDTLSKPHFAWRIRLPRWSDAEVTQMQVQGGNVQAVRETRSTYMTTQVVAWSLGQAVREKKEALRGSVVAPRWSSMLVMEELEVRPINTW